MQPTKQQQAIVNFRQRQRDRSVRVIAFAGTGKTTTLALLAEQESDLRVLYLAYNKAIQRDAEQRFAKHVTCRTTHALAFRATSMYDQQARLNRRLYAMDLVDLLGIVPHGTHNARQIGGYVLEAVRTFCYSAAPVITREHVRRVSDDGDLEDAIATYAHRLWHALWEPNSMIPLEHDFYLKLWQLRGGELPIRVDVIYLDEAQDANPVTLDIVQAQGIPVVYVGDPYQSIYRFRGATNAMHDVQAPALPLSESFRYGPRIASLANVILRYSSRPPETPITGHSGIDTALVDGWQPAENYNGTVLARTNAGVFAQAVVGNDAIHVVGGIDDITRLLMGGYRLRRGETVQDVPTLARFRSWGDFKAYAEEDIDREITILVQLVNEYGGKIPDLITNIRQRHVDEPMANRILSTAHRAKGREWDRVRLADDFPTYEDLSLIKDVEERDQEFNLLYVAATRAKHELASNRAIHSIVDNWRQQRQVC